MNKYYVSYNFQNKKLQIGFGSCWLELNCDKITSKAISEITKYITKENDFISIVIINVIRLEDEKE